MSEWRRRAAHSHFGDHHPLAVLDLGQVERDFAHIVAHELQDGCGLRADLVGVVAERDAEDVVDSVDTRLARVIIGERARGDERESQPRQSLHYCPRLPPPAVATRRPGISASAYPITASAATF